MFSFSCLAKTCMWLNPNWHSLLILNKLICVCVVVVVVFFCWRNNLQSICIRSTFWWPIKGPEKTPKGPRAGEQIGAEPTIEPLFAHCFSHWPWSLKLCLSPGFKLTPSLHLKLSRFNSSSILRFVFLVKALSCLQVLIWHFSLILRSDCFNTPWLKMLSALSFRNRDCFTETVLAFQPQPSPLEKSVLWKLDKKSLTWLFWTKLFP